MILDKLKSPDCGTCVYKVSRWDCFYTRCWKQTVSKSFGKIQLLTVVIKTRNGQMMNLHYPQPTVNSTPVNLNLFSLNSPQLILIITYSTVASC